MIQPRFPTLAPSVGHQSPESTGEPLTRVATDSHKSAEVSPGGEQRERLPWLFAVVTVPVSSTTWKPRNAFAVPPCELQTAGVRNQWRFLVAFNGSDRAKTQGRWALQTVTAGVLLTRVDKLPADPREWPEGAIACESSTDAQELARQRNAEILKCAHSPRHWNCAVRRLATDDATADPTQPGATPPQEPAENPHPTAVDLTLAEIEAKDDDCRRCPAGLLIVPAPADWQPASYRTAPPGTTTRMPFHLARSVAIELNRERIAEMEQSGGTVNVWSIVVGRCGLLTTHVAEGFRPKSATQLPPGVQLMGTDWPAARKAQKALNDRLMSEGRWALLVVDLTPRDPSADGRSREFAAIAERDARQFAEEFHLRRQPNREPAARRVGLDHPRFGTLA
ncbi:MAG: hypothetical protein NT069_33375, partial [Planctomycetota bacterium]|nr:hypothetical protein [Planctomycetota bacterium]